ncbi:MAG: hypothetical protein ABJN95_08675 [Maribacter sp.]|uniref:OB-fold protein n=1 Tax=Maribacter sp. TaxID=1897614 RepID=UPI0032985AEA
MKKKKMKYILMGLVAFTLASVGLVYNMVFNAQHRQIATEATAFTIPAEDLQFHFANDETKATNQFIDKVVETHGAVTEIAENYIILENRVQVDFLNGVEEDTNKGDILNVKGRCVGFDELLLLVKIDQATTIKTK